MNELLFITMANNLPRLRMFDKLKPFLFRFAGMDIKEGVSIWGPLTIRPFGGAKNISIGSNSFLNSDIRFGVPRDKIKIGNNVLVGPRVLFETYNHGLKYIPGKGRGGWSRPIVVEDECWIGAGAIILQDITIGRGSVITAGAVVTDDIPPLTVAGGVPAKIIKKIE